MPRLFIRVIGLPYDGGLVADRFEMTVQAIFGDVQFAALEPLDLGFAEIPLQNTIPLLLPGKMFSDFTPKSLRILDAFFILLFVLLKGIDMKGANWSSVFLLSLKVFSM